MRDYRRWILPGVLALALIAVGVWGYNQQQAKEEYRTAVNNEYQRLFYDMKSHIENVQVNLSKTLVAGSEEQNVLLLSQIMQQAYMAQDKLGQLPVPHSDISRTEKFLSQVADYSYALIMNQLDGNPMDGDKTQTLDELKNYATNFSEELTELHDRLVRGDINFNLVRTNQNKKLKEANEDMLNTRLVELEERMTDYPELIYDGPFSDQVMNIKPKGLGTKEVNEEQARKIANEFIGTEKTSKLTMFELGENSNTANIESFTFSVAPENEEKEPGMYISVSKLGGNVVWFNNPRNVSTINISEKQAEKEALKFLVEHGYESMESNYSLRYDGTVVINFVNKEGEVTVYPDLVKVKIALDTGEVVGFDAAAYLHSHHERDIKEPEISQEEARDKVKLDFDISNVRLAIIPKGTKEVLCYEFRGAYNEQDFIVYINASSGREEQILQIIKDENGTLTF